MSRIKISDKKVVHNWYTDVKIMTAFDGFGTQWYTEEDFGNKKAPETSGFFL